MTPRDRLSVSLAAARYLEALERDDHAALSSLWESAGSEPDLAAAFRAIHAGLLEERGQEIVARVAALAEEHLHAARVVRPAAGPVTVADVAEELFRHTPERLPAAAHQLNDTLRADREPLPADLGLTNFVAWAEGKHGPAPLAYWKAFRAAAIKLELRRASEIDYELAARRAAKPEDGKR